VLYLAALQGVPTTLYDAAIVDGANAFQRFWNITVPMTSPVIYFAFLTGMIGAFQTFTVGFITTSGGPANASLFYILYLYRNAWEYLKMGYGAAMAWVLFAILVLLTWLSLRVSRGLIYYESEGG
jgi:multiple sugar transport system permease protein